MEDSRELKAWCLALPKIELHAHLNGSIRNSTLLELARDLGEKGIIVFEDVAHIITNSGRSLSECFMLFDLFHVIATDHDTVTRITKEVVEDFASENVVYLELRTTPKNNESKGMTKRSYMKAVLDGLNAVDAVELVSSPFGKQCLKTAKFSKDQDRKNICVRLILSIDRRETTAAAMETVDLAIELRDLGVVGIDLSGNPLVGNWSTFLPALTYARENGLPVTIHCGEVHNKEEVNAILDFCPDRIGHACFLDEEDWSRLRSPQIPIEICLTSNHKTNCVPSIKDHHFVDLYSINHPMILCTDDPGLFSSSVSNEYYLAATTFELSRSEMYRLAQTATESVFADDAVKCFLREIFEDGKIYQGT
ncbi:adenosine/AMP deaminase family protein [Wolffia australiana]